jgi:hypothetical protein
MSKKLCYSSFLYNGINKLKLIIPQNIYFDCCHFRAISNSPLY